MNRVSLTLLAALVFALAATSALAQAPRVMVVPAQPLSVTLAPDRATARVHAENVGRRTILAEISRVASFPIVNLDRVGDEPIFVDIDGRPVAAIVRQILDPVTVDYVMTPSRLILSDKEPVAQIPNQRIVDRNSPVQMMDLGPAPVPIDLGPAPEWKPLNVTPQEIPVPMTPVYFEIPAPVPIPMTGPPPGTPGLGAGAAQPMGPGAPGAATTPATPAPVLGSKPIPVPITGPPK